MNRDMIKRGTTIYAKKPFAFTLSNEYRTTRCDNCLKSSDKLLKCSSCQYVYYCNRNCQKESWLLHKRECLHLKKALAKGICVLDMIRLMARIILKLNHGGADEIDYYTETNFRKFEDLMSHESNIKKDTKRMEHFSMIRTLLCEFLGETQVPNFEELIGIYGRIVINSFGISIADIAQYTEDNIAVGIYLGLSVINHSCKPNTVREFEGTTMILKTLDDIPCLDWSQITMSYIEVLDSKKNRREKLHSLYYFWCDCEICKQPCSFAEAAACPNLLCDFPCLIDAEKCEKCGTKLSKKFKETFLEVTDFTAQNLEKIATNFTLGTICLGKQKNILHRFNVQHISTLIKLFGVAIRLQYWEDANFYGEELIPGYLLYYEEMHPSVGMFYFTMGTVQLHLKKPRKAHEMLTKAHSVLMTIHGDNHSVKEHFKYLFHVVSMQIQNNS